jgi:hypothetical protein
VEECQLPTCIAVDVQCVHTDMWGGHNYTVYKDRHWTVKELAEYTGISSLYCSELFYLLINVPDCCQVSSTSFKLGATVGAL